MMCVGKREQKEKIKVVFYLNSVREMQNITMNKLL